MPKFQIIVCPKQFSIFSGPSAQFEHTLLVTDTGCQVLTERAGGRPWFMDQLEQLGYAG